MRVDNFETLFLLQKRNVREASLVVARAFQDDLIDSYFFPDPEERKKKLPPFYEYRIGQAVRYGTVYATSPNLEGIAAWLPSDLSEIPMWKMMLTGGFKLFRKMGSQVTSKMMTVRDFVESKTIKNAGDKYLHLEMLAVEPKLQGMGYAKKLLDPMFNRLDSENLPCFLETSTEKNVALYQYFGFEVVEESTIPGTDVPFWDMLRQPSMS